MNEISFKERINLGKKSSLTIWYPKIAKLPIPQIKTEIVNIGNKILSDWIRADTPIPDKYWNKMNMAIDKIGKTPIFMRTDQAIKLKNARDKKAGRKPTASSTNLARLLYPNQTPNTQSVSANKIKQDKFKRMSEEQIFKICHELGVDSNFLHGYPSIHDEDYERLVVNG